MLRVVFRNIYIYILSECFSLSCTSIKYDIDHSFENYRRSIINNSVITRRGKSVAIVGQVWNCSSIVGRIELVKKKKGGRGREGDKGIDRCFDWDKLESVIFSERFIFFRFEMEKLFTWNDGNLSRRSLTDEVTIFIRRRIVAIVREAIFSGGQRALWK